MDASARKVVGIWLMIGVFMLLMQIVIGGITRLTGSGLSITKWEIVTGTLPPLSEEHWQQEFDHYKATPQYHKINKGMELSDFKFIYFWEYFHRLWARSMGFVFAIPFFYFLWKGYIKGKFAWQLVSVIVLAAIVASFGWIMVASGLVERPYVNAYKLTLHLSLGISLYAYVLWLAYQLLFPKNELSIVHGQHKWVTASIVLLCLQLVLGGLMSGMKAGLFFPTWPDMNGALAPDVLTDLSNWHLDAFKHYDTNAFAPALVQFVHRGVAYILTVVCLVLFVKLWGYRRNKAMTVALILLPIILVTQVLLGIFTVMNSIGSIPTTLGVLHQAVAILLLSDLILIAQLTHRPMPAGR